MTLEVKALMHAFMSYDAKMRKSGGYNQVGRPHPIPSRAEIRKRIFEAVERENALFDQVQNVCQSVVRH